MNLPLKPSASTRSWQGASHSKVRRPFESVRPTSEPEACLTVAPWTAAPELSSTVRVRDTGVRTSAFAGRTSVATTVSTPDSAFNRNDCIRLTWGARGRHLEQPADHVGNLCRLVPGCQFDERNQDKVALQHPRMRNLQARLTDSLVPE